MALVIPAGTRSVEVVMPPQVQVLEQQLRINQQRCELLDSYYHGKHPHTFDSMRFQQAFGRQLRNFADNWMRLVINSTANRLTVQGFQVGSGEDILSADNDAWGIWQANDMDRASMMAHRETMKYGTSFVMVDPTVEPSAITVESPLQVVGQRSAANRFVLVNAIKKWVGDDGYLYLNYYDPDRVCKFRSASRAPSPVVVNAGERVTQPATWMPLGEVENPLGVVPIIPFENQPDTLIGGVSDLDDLIPLNDALNKVLRDMLVASEYQNFRQRYIIGAENPKDPVTGKPLSQSQAQLVASMSQFMAFPPTPKEDHPITVGEFGQVDLSPYIESIEMLIHHISMVSMTPAYMLVGKMANLPLALDTVVPTPSGRTTMGDIKAGDTVYAPDGTEQKVTDVLPIRYGRDCYRMTFDDGTEIVADAEHKWETTHFVNPEIPYSRRKGAQWETSNVTTEQIARSLKTSMGTNNHFIPVASPLHGPTLTYPIDPYALGCWLGDGNRLTGQLTSHVKDAYELADRLRAVGETVSVYGYPANDRAHADSRLVSLTSDKERCPRGHARSRGTKTDTARCTRCAHFHFRRRYYGEPLPERVNGTFRNRLKQLSVYGNKHIPEQYFLGSAEQRLALLQGIMDTDGSVDKISGVALTLHDERLATDVHRLAQTLGHKVNLRKRRWKSKGGSLSSVRESEGDCWRMSWTPPHIVFRMGRKASRQKLPVGGRGGKSDLPFRRYIVSCERTESVPVRCINVSGAAHLFLVTDACINSHNSADAIRAAELGFVGKLETKQTDFGGAWARGMGLALKAEGPAPQVTTLWKTAAANSGSVLSNELVQLNAINVPKAVLWRLYGATPQEIERWKAMNEAEPPTPAAPQYAPPAPEHTAADD
jgi:hypothetical protein